MRPVPRSFAPYAFTEHGAIMAATILSSPRAIEMSVYVVRALFPTILPKRSLTYFSLPIGRA
jgi:hypothetical protein